MTVSTWSPIGSQLYKGIDPQKVANEIMNIGGDATPQQIVDAARAETSELHGIGIGSGRTSGYGRYHVTDVK